MKHQHSERGQVFVLIILAIVAIFGFVAIAVDGGRIYAERRRAQSAADASAMAAAFAAMEGRDWSQAAMQLVQENDFNDTHPGVENDKRMDVHIHYPPISGPYTGDDEYYQVFIRSKVNQIFSQIVWRGQMEVTVEAVAHARPSRNIYPGHAMVATSEHACNAVDFSGSGDTYINGGNIFSNSDGTGNCASGRQNGGGAIKVDNGDILTVGDWVTKGGSGDVSPNPHDEGNIDKLKSRDYPMPDCYTGVPARSQATYSGTQVLEPGRYTGIKITNGDWKMKPGMYCFTSTGFEFNGGSLTGSGVVLMVLGGDVSVNGSGKISLNAPSNLRDGGGTQWAGMLINMPESNRGGIDLAGGSGATYTGTILAPGERSSSKPKCTFGGNSGSIGLASNIICNTVQVTGTAGVTIYYKPEANFKLPPSVDLSQ